MKAIRLLRILFLLCILPASSFGLDHDWKSSVAGDVTRCFEAKDIRVHCEDFTEPELRRGITGELQIEAFDFSGRKFFYSYEKGIVGSLCREHLSGIRRLLRGAKEACITGVSEWVLNEDGSTNAKWRAFESPKGKLVWY